MNAVRLPLTDIRKRGAIRRQISAVRKPTARDIGWTVFGLLLFATSVLCFAEARPQIANGKVVEQQSSGDLAKDVAAVAGPAWVAYAEPMIPGEHHMCCWDSSNEFHGNPNCCGGCALERHGEGINISDGVSNCKLEPASEFFVFLRIEGGKVTRIRSFSADCGIDASGMTVHWLNGIKPEQSIAFLTSFAEQSDDNKKAGNNALVAIAMHNSPAADAAIERLMSPERPYKLREQAAFWLGSTRGRRGFEVLRQAVRTDKDEHFVAEATFALSTSKEPEAQDELIRMARNDPRSRVREQALFWLAQKAGKKVSQTITDAIDNDPDTAVKRKAVFALSQMPEQEGVPLLIKTAQNNRNPQVRKEAMFWLGQSHDPRALDFIESVLKR
jgi:HEAT repeat protein